MNCIANQSAVIPKSLQITRNFSEFRSKCLLRGIENIAKKVESDKLDNDKALVPMLHKYNKIMKMQEKLANRYKNKGYAGDASLDGISKLEYTAASAIRKSLGNVQSRFSSDIGGAKSYLELFEWADLVSFEALDTHWTTRVVFGVAGAMCGGFAGSWIGTALHDVFKGAVNAANEGVNAASVVVGFIGVIAGIAVGALIAANVYHIKAEESRLLDKLPLKAAAERIMELGKEES